MKKKYSLTYPAEEILRAHKKGRFKAYTVYGDPRVGKSVYGIKSGRDIYMVLDGCDIDAAYEKALSCIKFDKKEVFGTIRKHMRSNEILPLLIWDDTGVHGSGYQFFLNPMEIAALKGTMDTIGTGVSGLIMTTPTPGGILKFIRDYHFPEIEITQLDGEWDRKAQPREYYHSKRGWRTRKTSVYDKFSCYLPKWVWNKYITRRKEVALYAIDKVLRVIDKQVGGSTGEDTKLKQIEEMTELKRRLENIESEERAKELSMLPKVG